METIDTSGGERSPEQGLIQHIADLEKQVVALQEKADMYDFLRFADVDRHPHVSIGYYARNNIWVIRPLRGKEMDRRVKAAMEEAAKIKRMRKMGITGFLSASDVRRFKL